ncbi:MAG: hypothetical protein IKQ22_00040 [Clostridia bacterium]|nr:hypothetical protein [Clostridia bacterium]
MKKFICFLLVLMMTVPITVHAENNKDELLIEAGFPYECIEGLDSDSYKEITTTLMEDPSKVQITYCTMDVDNLAEIEDIMSISVNQIVDEDIDPKEVEKLQRLYKSYLDMSDKDLSHYLEVPEEEARYIKMAIDSGILKNGNNNKIDNEVVTSGSISTSNLTYAQSVVNKSTATAPKYDITLTYHWSNVFAQSLYNDVIAVTWGGGLNVQSKSGTAHYYSFDNGGWLVRKSSKSMTTNETVQKGIKYSFKQSINNEGNLQMPYKSKSGTAKATIYQTQFQGYATNIVSKYYHKKTSMAASIIFNSSGVGISVSPTTVYDESPQRSSSITY